MAKQPKIGFKTSHKVRMSTASVVPGMYVCALDRPWEETPFLFQGFVLRSWEDVETLQEYCKTVVIDHEKYVELGVGPRRPQRPRSERKEGRRKRPPPSTPRVKVEEMLPEALETYRASTELIGDIMDDVRLGRAIDTPAAKEAVSACVDHVLKNPEAMLLLSRVRDKDAYTSQHCLSVAILSIALGRSLGMDTGQLNEVGLCGLLHDVGKVVIPDEVLLKPGPLTPQEMLVMQKHPVEGRNIIMSTDGLGLAALDVAHSHHERLNGSGYPRGLRADQLTPYTKIVAIADTYDAITSDRIYNYGRAPTVAFDVLWKGVGRLWDPRMVVHFVRALGVYSPGSVVELNTGALAVVVASNPGHRLRPRLLVLPPDDLPPEAGTLLDLSKVHTDPFGEPLQIVRMHSPSKAEVDLRELAEKGLLENLVELPQAALEKG